MSEEVIYIAAQIDADGRTIETISEHATLDAAQDVIRARKHANPDLHFTTIAERW